MSGLDTVGPHPTFLLHIHQDVLSQSLLHLPFYSYLEHFAFFTASCSCLCPSSYLTLYLKFFRKMSRIIKCLCTYYPTFTNAIFFHIQFRSLFSRTYTQYSLTFVAKANWNPKTIHFLLSPETLSCTWYLSFHAFFCLPYMYISVLF